MITILILSFLIAGLNVFWAWVCFGLIDRLMARDFESYKLASTYTTNDKPQISEDVIDPETERQAHEINSLFGIA